MDPGINDIVEDTLSSVLLSTRSRPTYIRYVQLPKFLLKNEQLLLLFKRVSQKVRTGKDLKILHLGSHVFYGSAQGDVSLTVEAVGLFINNPTKTFLFHTTPFHKATKLDLKDLRELYS